MASVFPLFGTAFFKHLGLGPSCSLLAGISMVLMFLYYVSRSPTLILNRYLLSCFT